MKRELRRSIVAAGLALFCPIGLGTAQAANLLATETAADIATFSASQFDVTGFTFTSSGESATGSGAFIANQTATGSALVALTEGPGGPISDWLELTYTNSGTAVSLTALWNSDSDPGGLLQLPILPTGVTAQFLAETGGVQDITALLVTSSGNHFPSNITVQVQSDAPEAVPEPASLVLLGSALVGFGLIRRRRKNV